MSKFKLPDNSLIELLNKYDEVFDKILELKPNFERMTISEMEQFKLSTEAFQPQNTKGEFYQLLCELLELEKEIKQKNN